MAPKKGKKGDAGPAVEAIKAVDRAFYEITIKDLTTKLANLRSYNSRTEERNLDLEAEMKRLEEDRTDVTAYLDRTLQLKTNLNMDLEEKLAELAKVRKDENIECKRQMREQELRYKTMQDELTSEIKLLTGKLNSLEEFRIQKDELLAKFDQQEDELRIQTKNHRELIYDIERKQVIDKDRIKKDVENRLLLLSNEFAKSNEIRISAHVQRLVRENIALNNELDRMMFSQRRLQNENDNMCEEATKRRTTLRTVNEEKDMLIRNCDQQIEVIRKMTNEFEQLQNKNVLLMEAMQLREEADRRVASTEKRHAQLEHKVNLLEQHLQAARSECVRHETLYKQQCSEMKRLSGILLKLKYSIKSAMKGEKSDRDHPEFRAAQRRTLLSDLLQLLVKVHERPEPVSSFETVPSVREIYQSGDMGVSPAMSIGSLLNVSKPVTGLLHRSRQNVGNMMDARQQELKAGRTQSYDSWPIVDLGSGSALLLSESSEGEAPPEENDGMEDEDQGVSSSEDENAPPPAAPVVEAAPPPPPPVVEAAPVPEPEPPVVEETNAEEGAEVDEDGEHEEAEQE